MRAEEGSILAQFSTDFDDLESPLLVSEGDSDDKLGSIRRSDYLTFAHQTFSNHEGGLVVFGHSLSKQDDHLVTPMKSWRDNPVAIAIRPDDDDDVIVQQKDEFRSRLSPMKNIVFFDSTNTSARRPCTCRARTEELLSSVTLAPAIVGYVTRVTAGRRLARSIASRTTRDNHGLRRTES